MFFLKFSPPSLHNCQFLKAKETTSFVNNTKKHRQSKTGNYRKIKLWRKVIRSLKIWSQCTSQRKGKSFLIFFISLYEVTCRATTLLNWFLRGKSRLTQRKNSISLANLKVLFDFTSLLWFLSKSWKLMDSQDCYSDCNAFLKKARNFSKRDETDSASVRIFSFRITFE